MGTIDELRRRGGRSRSHDPQGGTRLHSIRLTDIAKQIYVRRYWICICMAFVVGLRVNIRTELDGLVTQLQERDEAAIGSAAFSMAQVFANEWMAKQPAANEQGRLAVRRMAQKAVHNIVRWAFTVPPEDITPERVNRMLLIDLGAIPPPGGAGGNPDQVLDHAR